MDDRVYQFGDVTVDRGRFQVLKAGVPLELEPKAIEVLLFLIERRERLVLKEELLDGVWRDTFVTPNALTRVIAQLRKALGDDAQEAHVIETVPRKGYRFLPGLTVTPTPVIAADAPPPAVRPRSTPTTAQTVPIWRASVPLLAGAFLALAGWTWLRPPAAAPLVLSNLVQLTTAAGYEADPSLSADGRRLAYTAEENGFNEIYVRPIGDGNRIQVTSDGGQNVGAVWSPDGERIAYHSQARGGVWISPATGGASTQVANLGSEPAWSPDGSLLAYSTYQGAMAERAEIRIVAVAGGEVRPLTRPGAPRGGHRGPAWSHDGRRIAFYSFDGAVGSSVWIAPVGGGEPMQVAPYVTPNRIAFTPDDRAVCWSGTGPAANIGIGCVDLDRTGPAAVPVAVLQGVAGASGLSIARDGAMVYAIRRTESDLWSLPLSVAGKPSADPAPLMRDTSRNSFPAFSPDGQSLAFLSWRPGTPSDLWLMNLPTGRTALVAPGKDDEFYPTWMPDSRRVLMAIGKGPMRRIARVAIDTRQVEDVPGLPPHMANLALSPDGRDLAYHVANDTGGLTAWLVPAAGGTPVPLSPAQQSAGYPSWSPDGRRIALEVEDAGGTQVWVLNRDATGFRQVTRSSGQHWPHSWAPDSDRIAFAGERDGVWNVWTVSTTTGLVEQLTRFTKPNGYVRYPAWSPLNDRIVFEHATVTANVWIGRLTGGGIRTQ